MTKTAMNNLSKILEDGVARSDNDYVTNMAGSFALRFPKNSLDIPEATTSNIKNFNFRSYFEEVLRDDYEKSDVTAKELIDAYKDKKEKQLPHIDSFIDFVNNHGYKYRYNLKNIKRVIDVLGKKVNIQIPSTKGMKPLIISNDEAVAVILPIRIMS